MTEGGAILELPRIPSPFWRRDVIEWMEESRLTRRALANMLGVSVPEVNAMLKGAVPSRLVGRVSALMEDTGMSKKSDHVSVATLAAALSDFEIRVADIEPVAISLHPDYLRDLRALSDRARHIKALTFDDRSALNAAVSVLEALARQAAKP